MARLRAGEWVEVRSKEEILRTLDRKGQLDGMPFMPEMFAFCGKRFRVFRRAHKTCDTVFPIRSLRVADTVHLDTRCDGQAHGGCQAGCLLFWKEGWLRRLEPLARAEVVNRRYDRHERTARSERSCSEADVFRATRTEGSDSDTVYVCQATRLPYAAARLSPYDVRQYVEDYTSGNVPMGQWLRGVMYISYENTINLGIGLGEPLRWLYDRVQKLWGGLPYPRRPGRIPRGERTPTAHLDLQVGEMVRVRKYQEILTTCNDDGKNRGMGFDAEMVPYCEGTYRVLRRVTRIINESSGRMHTMRNPCIVLDGVVCRGRYSACRLFCPRSIFPYWREVWLERVGGERGEGGRVGGPTAARAEELS